MTARAEGPVATVVIVVVVVVIKVTSVDSAFEPLQAAGEGTSSRHQSWISTPIRFRPEPNTPFPPLTGGHAKASVWRS